jgi:hypothetical protein
MQAKGSSFLIRPLIMDNKRTMEKMPYDLETCSIRIYMMLFGWSIFRRHPVTALTDSVSFCLLRHRRDPIAGQLVGYARFDRQSIPLPCPRLPWVNQTKRIIIDSLPIPATDMFPLCSCSCNRHVTKQHHR